MLKKKMSGVAKGPRLSSALQDQAPGTVDRRAFLRNSGLAIGGLAAVSAVAGGRVREAEAAVRNQKTPYGNPKRQGSHRLCEGIRARDEDLRTFKEVSVRGAVCVDQSNSAIVPFGLQQSP